MCTIHLIDDEKRVKQYVLQTFFISRDNHMVSITISDFNNLVGISPGWLFIFPGRLFTMLKKPISSAFSFHFELSNFSLFPPTTTMFRECEIFNFPPGDFYELTVVNINLTWKFVINWL